MKILIEMTPEHYDGFLTRCTDAARPEYTILKNSIVVNRQIEGVTRRMVEILCDEPAANRLLAAAEALQLPAVVDIRKALHPLRDL